MSTDAAEKDDGRGGLRAALARIVIDTRPLKIVAYRRLWVSTIVTGLGSQLTAVAVPKQVYDVTGSSGYVGLAGGVGLVPLLVFGLWGGAIADAMDRRRIMLFSNVGVAVSSGLLWLQAFTELRSVWVVLVLLGVQQAFVAINMPTRSAAVARLVPTALLPAASALNFTVGTFAMVFGPLAAGVMIPVVGLSTLYLIDTVSLLVACGLVALLPAIRPEHSGPRTAGVRAVVDGFRYLSAKTVLLASFVLDMIAMIFGMPRALIPEMAERTFGDPPGGGPALGWLFAAIPLGAAVCGIFSGSLSRIPRQGVVVVVAIVVWGGAIAAFGLTHSLLLAVVFLAVAGAADLVSAVHRIAILQSATTDEMRGRMQGVFTVVVAGGPRIADLAHGWSAAAVGTGPAAWGGGLLVVVLAVVAAALMPAFWRYRATATPEPPLAEPPLPEPTTDALPTR